jgi:hypothetical protein
MVGRSRACDLVVDDGYVSDTHAALYFDGARAVLRDLGSQTGTWHNGAGLSGDAELRTGDRVQIGQTLFAVEVAADGAAAAEVPDDLAALVASVQTTPRDCARFALRAEAPTLFAVVDLADDAELLEAINESGEAFCALDETAEPDALGETAPFVVELSPGSVLLDAVLEAAWGEGRAVFLTSDAPFHAVYGHWLQRVEYDDEGNVTSARAWVPEVLGELLAGVDGAEVRALFGPVRRFLVEDEEGTGLVRWVEGGAGVESERVELRLNVPSEGAAR